MFALIPISLITILSFIGCFFATNLDDILYVFIICLIVSLVLATILFIVIFTNKIKYKFTQKAITILKDKQIQIISVDKVEKMTYYKYKWFYVFTSIFSPLPKGGYMKVHITLKNKSQVLLVFFSYKDALKIKSVHPNLLEII